jgi:DNA repair exonuclease SbcCD ATPase subunit
MGVRRWTAPDFVRAYARYVESGEMPSSVVDAQGHDAAVQRLERECDALKSDLAEQRLIAHGWREESTRLLAERDALRARVTELEGELQAISNDEFTDAWPADEPEADYWRVVNMARLALAPAGEGEKNV